MSDPSDDTDTGAPPRLVIIIAATLAAALAITVAVVGLSADSGSDGSDSPGLLTLPAAPAPESGAAECAALLEALPDRLESSGKTLDRRELADPAPRGAVAWGGSGGHEPVVLRCGVPKPSELTKTSGLRQINKVRWLPITGGADTTWYAVDRPVYVALTVPRSAGTGPIQTISDTVSAALESVSPRPPG